MNSEVFSAKPEVTVSKPLRDLKNEFFSVILEAIFQVAVRVVEQERGLELQVNFPEFTLATMLPIVIAIEPENVLKTEFFSARLETEASEPLSDLRNEVFSAKVEARVREPLRDLNSEDLSVKVEARPREGLEFLA